MKPSLSANTTISAAATRALEIDEKLTEAHTSMAFARFYYDWDWSGAEREFKRTVELNPSYAPAHQWYSHYLMAMGRMDESIAEARRAQELDPLSLPIIMNLGWQLYFAGRYDLARQELNRGLEIDQNYFMGHWFLGLVYERKRMYEKAIEELRQAVTASGSNPVMLASLARIYAVSGKTGLAREALQQLKELSKRRYVEPFWLALIHDGLGEKDQAFEWLEKGI